MAKPDVTGLSAKGLGDVVNQVNGRIDNLIRRFPPEIPADSLKALNRDNPVVSLLGPDKPKMDLGESFAVWSLGADAVAAYVQGNDTLCSLAKNTGRYHHQIRLNKQGIAYARSMNLGGGKWSLRELRVSSNLAQMIHEAIDCCDNDPTLTDEYLVRLLIVPAYQVYAFWLVPDETRRRRNRELKSKVLVISAPGRLKELGCGQALDPDFFLTALKGVSTIAGYVDDKGPGAQAPGPSAPASTPGQNVGAWPVMDLRIYFPPPAQPGQGAGRRRDNPGGGTLASNHTQPIVLDSTAGGVTNEDESSGFGGGGQSGIEFGGGGQSGIEFGGGGQSGIEYGGGGQSGIEYGGGGQSGIEYGGGGQSGTEYGGPPGCPMLNIRLFMPGMPARPSRTQSTQNGAASAASRKERRRRRDEK